MRAGSAFPTPFPLIGDGGASAGGSRLEARADGCSRVAVHFDVDTVDSDEIVLGLGAEPNGLTSAQVRRVVADVQQAAEVVGFTIAEFIPRQVMHLQRILDGFPLISGHRQADR